ncbi:MAG: YigZ family protein [Lachnospiraceae bacterium]|nr:YigZ family protein [Lachnospiraceae bacterium]
MNHSYRTLRRDETFSGEFTDRKSRFIASFVHTETEEEARAFLAAEKKKYYDARHHVSAYVIRGKEGAPDIVHSSDDGEPSGTAGKPVLDVITGADLKDVVMVVTRYFGGTLLGTGGLVRAYSGAAAEALRNAGIVEMRPAVQLTLVFNYPLEGKVRRLAEEAGAVLESTEYTEKVRFFMRIGEADADSFSRSLVEGTQGQIEIMRKNVGFFPFDVL